MSERADVVIVGGAIVGSAVATFLALRADLDARIVVVERDPSYRTSSTTLSAASIRQQFSTALNIRLSQFGIGVVRDPAPLLGVEGASAERRLRGGRLPLPRHPGGSAEPGGEPRPAAPAGRRRGAPRAGRARCPIPVAARRRPGGGSLGLSGEGWFDAAALLGAFRRKARALGVAYRSGEVVAVERDGDVVRGVRLADGTAIDAGWIVNAAGPRAAEVARMAGLRSASSRGSGSMYHVDSPARVASPLTIDPSGVYFRPEGPAYIAGFSPRDGEPDPATFDLRVEHRPFEDRVWPALAHRVPGFEQLRLLDAWAGHYEVHTLDHNAVIGPHPVVRNFLFANGFSGHGLQQAPAVGRGLAEWIATGCYETLDLAPLGYDRILRNEPIVERSVI